MTAMRCWSGSGRHGDDDGGRQGQRRLGAGGAARAAHAGVMSTTGLHCCLLVSTMPSQEGFYHVETPWRLVAGAWLLWPMANNAFVALTESQKEGCGTHSTLQYPYIPYWPHFGPTIS